jgi:hypothetical protein
MKKAGRSVTTEYLLDQLFESLPCGSTCDLRPVLRNDNKVAIKIGTIVDSGGRNANAATVWSGREGRVHVLIWRNGRIYLDWPDLEIDQIAGKICEFCGKKTSRFLGSPCRYRRLL